MQVFQENKETTSHMYCRVLVCTKENVSKPPVYIPEVYNTYIYIYIIMNIYTSRPAASVMIQKHQPSNVTHNINVMCSISRRLETVLFVVQKTCDALFTSPPVVPWRLAVPWPRPRRQPDVHMSMSESKLVEVVLFKSRPWILQILFGALILSKQNICSVSLRSCDYGRTVDTASTAAFPQNGMIQSMNISR